MDTVATPAPLDMASSPQVAPPGGSASAVATGSAAGGLAEPPALQGAWAVLEPYARPAFLLLNRRFMLPLHRAGLAAWMGTPIGGYILVIRVRGRNTGLTREIPLSYLVAEGAVWVMAGFGPRTEWYRNILAEPLVELRLPGRRQAAIATEERDPSTRSRMMPALARAAGLPGLLIGLNPWTATDAAILDALDWVPLIRIDPVAGPLEAGPDDPGGRAWLWRQGLVVALSAGAVVGLGRLARTLRRVPAMFGP